jgi:hypothetical protein
MLISTPHKYGDILLFCNIKSHRRNPLVDHSAKCQSVQTRQETSSNKYISQILRYPLVDHSAKCKSVQKTTQKGDICFRETRYPPHKY